MCGKQVGIWQLDQDREIPSLSSGQGNLVNKMKLQLHTPVAILQGYLFTKLNRLQMKVADSQSSETVLDDIQK